MPALNTRGRHDDRQDQPEGIDEEMALAPLDLFARIYAQITNPLREQVFRELEQHPKIVRLS
jgi:hypothetical protein